MLVFYAKITTKNGFVIFEENDKAVLKNKMKNYVDQYKGEIIYPADFDENCEWDEYYEYLNDRIVYKVV